MTRNRRTHRIVAGGLLAALALLATGCGDSLVPTIDQDFNGKTYNLAFGSTLKVQLPVPAALNVNWRINNLNQAFLRRIDNPDSIAPGSREQLADGSWVETFLFQGVTRGVTSLNMIQVQDQLPTGESFSINVNILGLGI